MGRLRGWIKRLERARQEDGLVIEQADGTTARFQKRCVERGVHARGRTIEGNPPRRGPGRGASRDHRP
jgi:hypothetical protein